jgi:hypothetical protein
MVTECGGELYVEGSRIDTSYLCHRLGKGARISGQRRVAERGILWEVRVVVVHCRVVFQVISGSPTLANKLSSRSERSTRWMNGGSAIVHIS